MKTLQAPILMTNEQIVVHAAQCLDMRTMCKDYFDSVINRDRRMWQGRTTMYSFDTSDVNDIKIIIHYAYGTECGLAGGIKKVPINEFHAWCAEYYKVTLTSVSFGL